MCFTGGFALGMMVDEPGHPTYDALHLVLDFSRSRLLPPV
jgi:hypothetical protein